MTTSRLEAFSDGVYRNPDNVMVLELRPPHEATLESLRPLVPVLVSFAQLRLSGNLLDEPSPSDPCSATCQRESPLGKSSSSLLAVAGSICNCVDG